MSGSRTKVGGDGRIVADPTRQAGSDVCRSHLQGRRSIDMPTFALTLHIEDRGQGAKVMRDRLVKALPGDAVVGPCNSVGDCEVLIGARDQAEARDALENAIVFIDAAGDIALVELGKGVAPRRPE